MSVRQDLSRQANDLVRSALDVAELLVQHVLRPAQLRPDPPEVTREAGDVAMLLRLADRVLVGEADQGRIAVLAWRVARHARTRRIQALVAARPSRAAEAVLAHGCLHQLGCRDDAFDTLARAALTASASAASGSAPTEQLESAWIRHLILGDGELEDPAIAGSPLGTGVDLVATSTEEAVAFARALSRATDFGRRPLPGTVDTERLSATADALVLKALAEDDLDLLAELVPAPALLRREWSPVQWFGWRVLCDTWGRYGFVPGPELPPAEEGEDAAKAVRRVLGSGYHPTLVAGMAVATLVSTGRLPASTPPSDPAGGLTLPDVSAGELAWQQTWHSLYLDERQALAAVPVGLALHRAMEATDVVAIVDALQAPASAALPGPLVTQAGELIDRLALLVADGPSLTSPDPRGSSLPSPRPSRP